MPRVGDEVWYYCDIWDMLIKVKIINVITQDNNNQLFEINDPAIYLGEYYTTLQEALNNIKLNHKDYSKYNKCLRDRVNVMIHKFKLNRKKYKKLSGKKVINKTTQDTFYGKIDTSKSDSCISLAIGPSKDIYCSGITNGNLADQNENIDNDIFILNSNQFIYELQKVIF